MAEGSRSIRGTRGPTGWSAKEAAISAGHIAAGATDATFIAWLITQLDADVAQGLIDASIAALVGGATAGGNTLKELEDRLVAEIAARSSGDSASAAALAAAIAALIGGASAGRDTLGELSAAIDTEAASRASGDATNAAAITAEAADRAAAVAAEATTRAAADTTNANAIAAEATDRAAAVAAEATARAAADTTNASAIAAEATTRAAADTTNASAITDEAAARAAADTTNANAITAEAATRAAADTTNANAITAEAATRAAADTTNANAITTEATARAAGDSTNATAIAAEATARAAGDDSLGADILNEAAARDAADDVLTAAIAAEATARAAADNQVKLDLRDGAPAGRDTFLEMSNALDAEAAARAAADLLLDAEDAALQAAIDAEAAARAAADNQVKLDLRDGAPSGRDTFLEMSDALDEETFARIAADAALETAQAGGLIRYETWTLLAAHPTGDLEAGFSAEVIGDAGTHTDPVVGGTVANDGAYRWSVSPAGWRRIGNRASVDAAVQVALAETAVDEAEAAAAEAEAAVVALGAAVGVVDEYEGFLHIERDVNERRLFAIDDAGTFLAKLGLVIGVGNGLTLDFDERTGVTTLSLGSSEGGGVITGGEYEGYLYVITDANRRILWAIPTEGDQVSETLADLTAEVEDARGTAASVDARLSAGLSPEGLPKGLYANTRFLRDWRYKSVRARLATGLCSVALLGDSWTYYNDPSRNFAEKLATLLQAAYGNGGPGWVSMGIHGGDHAGGAAGPGITSVTHNGTWAEGASYAGRGPDMSEATSSTLTNTVVVVVSATNLTVTKLLYLKKSGGGDFRYRFDSGAWTTVATANASDLLGVETLTPPTAAHTLTIEVTAAGSTGVTLFGASMTKASGAVVHRLSLTGSTTTHWAATQAIRDAALAALDPDVLQIMLGTNDQGVSLAAATYKSNLANLITRRRAGRANADVVLVSVPENLGGRAIPMTSYRDAARACAFENDAVFADALTAFGETLAEYNTASPRAFITSADNIHPQASGFDELTDVFAGLYLSRS